MSSPTNPDSSEPPSSSETTTKQPVPDYSPEEFKKFVRNVLDNKVFLHVQIDNPSLLGMVFMPIGLGGFGQLDVDTIGMIYEFYDQAMPRSVNGYPCFATCRFINKTDWEKAHRILLREYERRETQLAEELEAPMPTYRILRFYQGDHPAETLKTGISLAEAKAQRKPVLADFSAAPM